MILKDGWIKILREDITSRLRKITLFTWTDIKKLTRKKVYKLVIYISPSPPNSDRLTNRFSSVLRRIAADPGPSLVRLPCPCIQRNIREEGRYRNCYPTN